MRSQLAPTPPSTPGDSIAAAIAHEVNNLLTPVIGLADLLEHTGGDAEIRDQLIERAVERCQRAVAICGLLIDLAKDGPDGAPTVPLASALSAALEAASTRANRADVRMECGFDEPGEVSVPGAAVEHIVLNLLLNAITASPPGGTVTVSASYAPGSAWRSAVWRLRVVDRGPGLEGRSVAAINQGGLPAGSTGIGLAVVRMLCRRWGGRLEAESEPGVGTTFHVELPAA